MSAAAAAAEAAAASKATAEEVEEDDNDDEGEADAEETALGGAASGKKVPTPTKKKRKTTAKVTWVGTPVRTDAADRTHYSGVKIGDLAIALGDVIRMEGEQEQERQAIMAFALHTFS